MDKHPSENGVDLTEAIENEAACWCDWVDGDNRCSEHANFIIEGKHYCARGLRNGEETVNRLAPIIAAAVRAQVAAEIQSRIDWCADHAGDRDPENLSWYLKGLEDAQDLARARADWSGNSFTPVPAVAAEIAEHANLARGGGQ